MSPRSADELRAAAQHVAHEIRMLRRAWNNSSEPLAYTAWFVHCRNLMKFFEGSGQKDEVKVSDFLEGVEDEWSQRVANLQKPKKYREYRHAVDKLAVHLTWDRIDAKWADFPPSQDITEYLLGLSMLLIRILPPGRATWLSGALL
jgi:hypothetical protein